MADQLLDETPVQIKFKDILQINRELNQGTKKPKKPQIRLIDVEEE